MIFENLQLKLEELPDVKAVQYQQLAPAYLRVTLLSTGIFHLVLLVVVVLILVFGEEIPSYVNYVLPAAWVLLCALGVWLAIAGYRIKAYALRQKDILYRKGVIVQSITAIPFNRVQHCEIKQGPIARYFGLKTLAIFTAGGQSSDLSIPGLLPHEAEQLKDFIIKTTAEDRHEEE